MARPTASRGPPGGKGTTSLTGRLGYAACASASAAGKAPARKTTVETKTSSARRSGLETIGFNIGAMDSGNRAASVAAARGRTAHLSASLPEAVAAAHNSVFYPALKFR